MAKEKLRTVCVHDLMILHNNQNITEQLVEIERNLKTGMGAGVSAVAGAGAGSVGGAGAVRGVRTGAWAGVSGPALGGAEGYAGPAVGTVKSNPSIGQKLCMKIVGEKVTAECTSAHHIM